LFFHDFHLLFLSILFVFVFNSIVIDNENHYHFHFAEKFFKNFRLKIAEKFPSK